MSRKKKIALFAGIPVVLAASAFALLSRSGKSDLIEVETAAVEARKIVQTVTATGRIQPMTQVNISADVSAKITRLGVKEGDWVEKGPVPARARPRALPRRGRERRGQPAVVGGRRRRRPREHGQGREGPRAHAGPPRARASSRGPISTLRPRPYEVEKARLRSALDQVEQVRAALKQARDDLSKTTIYAPMAGTVVEAQQGGRRDRPRLAVPGGRHPGARQPRRHGGPGRRRRERHRLGSRSATRRRSRSTRCPDVTFEGDGHRDRQQRARSPAGHHGPEDRVRGQDRDPRSRQPSCVPA